MASKTAISLFVLVTLVQASLQNLHDNTVDEDVNPLSEAASAIIQNENFGDVGGLLSNLMQSQGGKHLGSILAGAANNGDATNEILSGLGSLISNKDGQIDPSVIGNVLGMLAEQGLAKPKTDESETDFDFSNIMDMLSGFMKNSGLNLESAMNLFPMFVSTLNSFTGPDAQHRAEEHASHAWLLPPFLEKLHIFYDHFIHSDLGKSLWRSTGAQAFFKTFSKPDGAFDYDKFFSMLENQYFRKYWISRVTRTITDIAAYFTDPKTHVRYLQTVQQFLNSILRNKGYPKAALFDPSRPAETISTMINHSFKKYFGTKVNSKTYVHPVVKYVQEVIDLVQKQGMVPNTTFNSTKLSDKLTDTLNLEIIEPVIRVYRAYRFAKKVPECDKYVMCLINQENPNERLSIPGLKSLLSKGTSIYASWFLSGHTGTSFWTLYNYAVDEKDCKAKYHDSCNEFHMEEIKVTTEYEHNEL